MQLSKRKEEQSKRLTLKKTHDHCNSKNPRLAVILIHGIASDSSAFKHALKNLEAKKNLNDVRFITFDLLGSGKSLKDDNLNYDYKDQLEALHNSIKDLNLNIPVVFIGHSLGTFIVTHYAAKYKSTIESLILLSPPVYTKKDFKNPAFEVAIKMFKDAIALRNRKILEDKAFKNSMKKIALNPNNYDVLLNLKTPATLIYGSKDQIIASFNYPKLLKANSNLKAIETNGHHGITHDKYDKIPKILEEILNA